MTARSQKVSIRGGDGQTDAHGFPNVSGHAKSREFPEASPDPGSPCLYAAIASCAKIAQLAGAHQISILNNAAMLIRLTSKCSRQAANDEGGRPARPKTSRMSNPRRRRRPGRASRGRCRTVRCHSACWRGAEPQNALEAGRLRAVFVAELGEYVGRATARRRCRRRAGRKTRAGTLPVIDSSPQCTARGGHRTK
jgi:hypothetical protein